MYTSLNKYLIFMGLVLSCGLVGCVSQPEKPSAVGEKVKTEAAKPVAPVVPKMTEAEAMQASLNKANELYLSHQQDAATVELKGVAVQYPSNKAPWLRMAQANFDFGSYSEAIDNAQEVLKRDSKDKVANSIIVVSGLRLAVKSLTELRNQNEVSGSLKNDAQELAKVLRESLGESSLVTSDDVKKKPKPAAYKKPASSSTTTPVPSASAKPSDAKGSGGGNPFEVLN